MSRAFFHSLDMVTQDVMNGAVAAILQPHGEGLEDGKDIDPVLGHCEVLQPSLKHPLQASSEVSDCTMGQVSTSLLFCYLQPKAFLTD